MYRPLPRDRGAEEFRGDPTAWSGPEMKEVPKMALRKAQMWDNPGGELDSAVDDRRRCKNSISFYPA